MDEICSTLVNESFIICSPVILTMQRAKSNLKCQKKSVTYYCFFASLGNNYPALFKAFCPEWGVKDTVPAPKEPSAQ